MFWLDLNMMLKIWRNIISKQFLKAFYLGLEALQNLYFWRLVYGCASLHERCCQSCHISMFTYSETHRSVYYWGTQTLLLNIRERYDYFPPPELEIP